MYVGQVDHILEQLSVFWANTEVVLDVLTKKGQHVEQFIGFATKPKLLARFKERLEEYKRFWEGVSIMCNNYILGVQNAQAPANQQKQQSATTGAKRDPPELYSFLDKNYSLDVYDQTPPVRSTFSGKSGTGPMSTRTT